MPYCSHPLHINPPPPARITIQCNGISKSIHLLKHYKCQANINKLYGLSIVVSQQYCRVSMHAWVLCWPGVCQKSQVGQTGSGQTFWTHEYLWTESDLPNNQVDQILAQYGEHFNCENANQQPCTQTDRADFADMRRKKARSLQYHLSPLCQELPLHTPAKVQ